VVTSFERVSLEPTADHCSRPRWGRQQESACSRPRARPPALTLAVALDYLSITTSNARVPVHHPGSWMLSDTAVNQSLRMAHGAWRMVQGAPNDRHGPPIPRVPSSSAHMILPPCWPVRRLSPATSASRRN